MQQVRLGPHSYELRRWGARIGVSTKDTALWGFAGTLKYDAGEVDYFEHQLTSIKLTLGYILRDFIDQKRAGFPITTDPTFEMVDSIEHNVGLTVMLVLNSTLQTSIIRKAHYLTVNPDTVAIVDEPMVRRLHQTCTLAMQEYGHTPDSTYITYQGRANTGFFHAFSFRTEKESESNLASQFLLVPCLKNKNGDYFLLSGDNTLIKSDLLEFEANINRYSILRPGVRDMIWIWKLIHQYGSDRSGYLAQLPPYAFGMLMLLVLDEKSNGWWTNSTFKEILDAGFVKIISLLDSGKILPSPYLETEDLLSPFRGDADELREWCQIWLAVSEEDLLQVLNGCITYK